MHFSVATLIIRQFVMRCHKFHKLPDTQWIIEDTKCHMQLQCIVLESPFSYCAETSLKEKKISLCWTVISAPVTRITKIKVQAYSTLRPRAIGRHIVGQQLPTLSNVTCCVRLHTLLYVGINLGFWGNCPATPSLS